MDDVRQQNAAPQHSEFVKVAKLDGHAVVRHADGSTSTLKVGMVLHAGDVVLTDPGAKALMLTEAGAAVPCGAAGADAVVIDKTVLDFFGDAQDVKLADSDKMKDLLDEVNGDPKNTPNLNDLEATAAGSEGVIVPSPVTFNSFDGFNFHNPLPPTSLGGFGGGAPSPNFNPFTQTIPINTLRNFNVPAVITGDINGAVTEAGGINNSTHNITSDSSYTGHLQAADVDNPPNTFQAVTTPQGTQFGSFTMTADGVWTYFLDNTNPQVQSLNELGATNPDGQPIALTDHFTVRSVDGTTQLISVTIQGTNDAAIITTHSVIDGTPYVFNYVNEPFTGHASDFDVDNTLNTFQAVTTPQGTTFGSFTMTADGVWTYTLTNTDNGATGSNATSDNFTITSIDGTEKVVTIQIYGPDHQGNALIQGDTAGVGTELGGNINSSIWHYDSLNYDLAGQLSTSGSTVQISPTLSDRGYGTFSIDASGNWTYHLDSLNPDVNSLTDTGTLTDTFTINVENPSTSGEFSKELVTVTIGAGGIVNQVNVDSIITGTLSVTDPDGFHVTAALSNPSHSWQYSIDGGHTWTPGNYGTPGFDILSADMPTDRGLILVQENTSTNPSLPDYVDIPLTITDYSLFDTAFWQQNNRGEALWTYNSVTADLSATGDSWEYSIDNGTTWLYGVTNLQDSHVSFNITGKDMPNDLSYIKIYDLTSSIDIAASISFSNLGTGYGSFSYDSAGHWTYTVDNNNPVIQELNVGESVIDHFHVISVDQSSKDIQVTIHGSNDLSRIITTDYLGNDQTRVLVANDSAGSYIDNSQLPDYQYVNDHRLGARDQFVSIYPDNEGFASLGVHDVDNPANFILNSAPGQYGSFGIDLSGNWFYQADLTNPSVRDLHWGQTLHESFTAQTNDGQTQQLTADITGQENVLPLTSLSPLTEAGTDRVYTGSPDTGYAGSYIKTPDLSTPFEVSGTLSVNADKDPTNGQYVTNGQYATPPFIATPDWITSDKGYGTFSLTADGQWDYRLDNTNPDVEALNAGSDPLTDSITVLRADGAYQTIQVVTINGTNDAAIVTGDISGEVTEQGSSGIQPESTFSSASGKLDDTDVDNPSHLFQEQGTLDSSGALLTGESSTYGKFAIDSSGRWAYELDNSNPLVNALNNGDTRHDYFFVRTSDGTQQLIDITIHGTNDSTAITGNDSGNVTEAGSERTYTFDNSSGFSDLYSMTHNTFDSYEARGTLAGASDFNEVSIAPTAYGTFSIDRSGNWTYDLDNSNPDVNALNTTGYMDDTYTVSTKDGAQKTVTIHIAGTNDAAYFGGILDGSITEQDANSDLSYNSSISGLALVVNDVDNGVNFTADAALSDQGFGSFTIDSSGQWTYILDNSNLTVEQLDQGQTLSDSFTIHSEDGTPQVINITIHGATDYSELPSNPEDSFNAEPGSYIIHAGALGNQVGDVSANSGNDLIIVAPHDPSSLVSGGTILPHDVIHNFTLDTENKTNDIIVLGTSDSQPRIEAFNSLGNMSTANNTISGHSIDQYGVITFLGGNGSLAEKIDYLINNDINGQLSTTKGSTVVFTDNTNISYVYSQQGPDAGIISGYSFVEVQGNYAAEGLDIGPQNVHHNNYIHIDHQ